MDVATHFPLILQRVFNTPLVLRPEKAEMVRLALAERIGVADPSRFAIFDEDERAMTLGGGRRVERRGYDVIDNIAIIPICGTLVQKLGQARPWCGMLGYDSIRYNFNTALEDEEVDGILLDIDSPGGEVAGCFDLADAMLAARGTKPVWAHCNEQMCSGAFAVGCTADRIISAGTGVSGSIGVVWMHVDWSQFNADHGLNVTYITRGKRKIDGNPDQPLSDEAAAIIGAQIDAVGERFEALVGRARNIDPKAVLDLQAGVFMGKEANKNRLVDEIMPIDQAFAAFRQELNS
jgi:signal peptide peptidase SppA